MAATDPFTLRVDFLPCTALPLPGRLGLTRAPGRPGPGRSAERDDWLRQDVDDVVAAGGTVLVTLLERMELARIGDVRRAARRAGIRWIPFPIPDLLAPRDPGAARALVRDLVGALERGEGVVLHCWGGLGRAGTIAACLLVARGVAPGRAIDLVRAARPGAVQTPEQEAFVREFAGA